MPSPHPALTPFIAAVRSAVTVSTDPADTEQRVAAALRVQPPPADVVAASTLPADLRQANSSVRRHYDRRQLDDEAERPER